MHLDPRRDQLNGLSVYEFDGGQLSKRTFAAEAVFGEGWEGHDVWEREFTSSSTAMPFKTFAEQDLPLEPPEYFETQRPAADRMSYGQLRTYIGELRASGFDVVQPAAALHRKLSFPLVSIIMTLIALPFAVTTGCRGAMYGVGIGIAVSAVVLDRHQCLCRHRRRGPAGPGACGLGSKRPVRRLSRLPPADRSNLIPGRAWFAGDAADVDRITHDPGDRWVARCAREPDFDPEHRWLGRGRMAERVGLCREDHFPVPQ